MEILKKIFPSFSKDDFGLHITLDFSSDYLKGIYYLMTWNSQDISKLKATLSYIQ